MVSRWTTPLLKTTHATAHGYSSPATGSRPAAPWRPEPASGSSNRDIHGQSRRRTVPPAPGAGPPPPDARPPRQPPPRPMQTHRCVVPGDAKVTGDVRQRLLLELGPTEDLRVPSPQRSEDVPHAR